MLKYHFIGPAKRIGSLPTLSPSSEVFARDVGLSLRYVKMDLELSVSFSKSGQGKWLMVTLASLGQVDL